MCKTNFMAFTLKNVAVKYNNNRWMLCNLRLLIYMALNV
uniref:Uncharacterized protein n=1 Tax=Anguilla anguilla TaxID=7936 RepID=A0A0E9RKX9_ANGAN